MIVHCFVATVNGPLCYKSHGWLALLADLRRHDPLLWVRLWSSR